MAKLRNILDKFFTDTVRREGFALFNADVVEIMGFEYGAIQSNVADEKKYYEVSIAFNNEALPANMLCDCPDFKKEKCKHLVALLYELNKLNYFLSTKHRKEFEQSLEDGTYFDDYDDEDDDEDEEEYEDERETDVSIFTELVRKTQPQFYEYSNRKGEKKFWSQLSRKYVSEKEWKEDQKQYEKEQKFNDFKQKMSWLLPARKSSSSKTKYKIVYGISTQQTPAQFLVLRQRLRKDGTVGDTSVAHSLNTESLETPLSLEEKVIADFIISRSSYHYSYNHSDRNVRLADLLSFLTEKEVYHYSGYNIGDRISILKEKATATLLVNETGKSVTLSLQIHFPNGIVPAKTAVHKICDEPLWVMVQNKIVQLSNLNAQQFSAFVENESKIEIPKVYLEYFEEYILPNVAAGMPIVSNCYAVEQVAEVPKKKIFLEEEDSSLAIHLKFGYGNHTLPYNAEEQASVLLKERSILRIVRNRSFEDAARDEIKSLYVKEIEDGIFSPRNNPVDFLFNALPALSESGFEILGDADLSKFKVNTAKPKISFAVTSGVDWFDLEANVDFNGVGVSLSDLLASVRHKKQYITLSDGSVGILPEEWMNRLKQSLSLGEAADGKIRFSKIQASALDALLSNADNAVRDDKFSKHVTKLRSFETIQKHAVTPTFNGELREYQKAGFDWFHFLQEYSFGGILADDMGLGKTIQVLALFSKIQSNGKSEPHLIVAPTSVVFNWMNEAERFAPSLKILNHTGNERIKESHIHFEEYDAVLTSYAILLRDFDLFLARQFNYVILDESQKIKNPASKSAKLVKELKARHRLCLTGTPVENSLNELWSQMSFVNPGLFGSLNKFQEAFVKPVQKENDKDSATFLKRTIYPFVLRRTKEVVAKELPPKTEIIHYCEMEPEQEKIYALWKDSIRKELMKEIAEKGIQKSGFKVIEALLRLRQICNHPTLVNEKYDKQSGKFEEFKEMIEKVIGEGHKALVFSQFVTMLEIMRAYLDEEKIPYEYLTGSTINREACVKNFQQNDDVKIFLISLKAGGFGLNLTAADYVFHYDPWWNPAVEAQATDRTHRIGQNKNVFVYKFITKNSVEEKILLLQEKKRELVQNIITSETGILKNLTKEDIEVLFE